MFLGSFRKATILPAIIFSFSVCILPTVGQAAEYATSQQTRKASATASAKPDKQKPKESVSILSSDTEEDAEISNMSLREVVLLRLRAAHEKGYLKEVKEEDIAKLSDEDLERIAEFGVANRALESADAEPASEDFGHNTLSLLATETMTDEDIIIQTERRNKAGHPEKRRFRERSCASGDGASARSPRLFLHRRKL